MRVNRRTSKGLDPEADRVEVTMFITATGAKVQDGRQSGQVGGYRVRTIKCQKP
jgi:hypothetical protein